jgi:hypothetical protein
MPKSQLQQRLDLEQALIKAYRPRCNCTYNLLNFMGGNYGLRTSNGKISR